MGDGRRAMGDRHWATGRWATRGTGRGRRRRLSLPKHSVCRGNWATCYLPQLVYTEVDASIDLRRRRPARRAAFRRKSRHPDGGSGSRRPDYCSLMRTPRDSDLPISDSNPITPPHRPSRRDTHRFADHRAVAFANRLGTDRTLDRADLDRLAVERGRRLAVPDRQFEDVLRRQRLAVDRVRDDAPLHGDLDLVPVA